MSLQTRLGALITAIGADIKALYAGKVDTNDSRLSDAREWTAGTVSQAEAEAGTATTRRAWTAERVRQAIAAWWLTASSAFGRTLANVADAAAGRTALGLGTAATATVTTSANDTTAGRLTKVGDFGWGGEPLTLTGSWNDLTGQSRLVKGLLSTTTDGPFNLAYWLFGSCVRLEANNAHFLGVTANGTNPQIFLRVMTGGTWRPWVEMARNGFDARFPSITFPATQVASSDPNALDDYEEGTFTPVAVGTTTTGVGTYSTQVGRYTKIGNRVLFSISLNWTSHTGTGDLRIDGLPFTPGAMGGAYPSLPVNFSNLNFTAGSQVSALVNTSSAQVLLRQTSPNAAVAGIPMDTLAAFNVSGHYEVKE